MRFVLSVPKCAAISLAGVSRIRRVVVLLGLAALLAPAPASGHAGGRAQLYVASATIAPQSGGWSISTVLRDLDSGATEPGFVVEVLGTYPSGAAFGPTTLADPEGDGRYDGTLPAGEGNWLIRLRANEIPGGPAALPVQRAWNVTLRPGEAVELAGPASGGKRSGTNAVPLVVAVGGATLLALVIGVRRGRRRGTVAPAG